MEKLDKNIKSNSKNIFSIFTNQTKRKNLTLDKNWNDYLIKQRPKQENTIIQKYNIFINQVKNIKSLIKDYNDMLNADKTAADIYFACINIFKAKCEIDKLIEEIKSECDKLDVSILESCRFENGSFKGRSLEENIAIIEAYRAENVNPEIERIDEEVRKFKLNFED